MNHHDEVTTIATALALRHPKMEAVQLSESSGHSYRVVLECKDDKTAGAPSTWLGAAWKAVLGAGGVLYRMGHTIAKYHKMATYIERIESEEGDHCKDVCHKDGCSGTFTNPIPRGITWKRRASRTTEKGCCSFAADACDLCCT